MVRDLAATRSSRLLDRVVFFKCIEKIENKHHKMLANQYFNINMDTGKYLDGKRKAEQS